MQQQIIRNKGYLNNIKKPENTRILLLNLYRLRYLDNDKIQTLINKTKEMQIYGIFLTKKIQNRLPAIE